MGTQGLVSVCREGKVVLKIVAGHNGAKAEQVAHAICRLGHLPAVDEAYELAKRCEFGTDECLVVMSRRRIRCDGSVTPSQLYRRTFKDPNFNPRWKHGTADHAKVVEL